MNACTDAVRRFIKRLEFLDNAGHFLSRMTDVASSALTIAADISVRQAAKEISLANGSAIAGSKRESTQQKINQASVILSHSSISLNLVRLFCQVFTLPFSWSKAACANRKQSVEIADALISTAFVAHRAFAVAQYFGGSKVASPTLGYATHGILGFGVVGSFSLSCYKWVYGSVHGSCHQCCLDIIRSGMDLVSWVVDTVRYGVQNSKMGIVSAAVGLADAVVWVSTMLVCDSFYEGAEPVIRL